MLDHPEKLPETLLDLLTSYYFAADQPIIQYLPECAQYDSELTYTLRPGKCRFKGRYFDTEIEVNALGVRDDERSLIAPEIIVLGDSQAMGWGVEQDERFSEIIERQSGLTVLNLAVSSYGTARELQMLERADTSNLRLLIIQYSENDLAENIAYLERGNRVPHSSAREYAARQKAHLERLGYYPGKHLRWLLSALMSAPTGTESQRPSKVQPNQAVESPHSHYFINALRHSPVPLRHYHILVLAQDTSLSTQIRTRQALGSNLRRLHFLPVANHSNRYLLDGHLNTLGHQKIAASILERLEYLDDAARSGVVP